MFTEALADPQIDRAIMYLTIPALDRAAAWVGKGGNSYYMTDSLRATTATLLLPAGVLARTVSPLRPTSVVFRGYTWASTSLMLRSIPAEISGRMAFGLAVPNPQGRGVFQTGNRYAAPASDTPSPINNQDLTS